jgi:hypothetical protein
MYPRSAIKTYKGSGVNPAGAEQPFIYKDPPKAIFTRKYEPVNEFEIQTFIRPDSEYADPSRVNESIKYFARGQNPMVEVSYSNVGGAQTNQSLGNFQASNPYKVEVVRPPMYPIETLVPISAPRIHQNYSMHTNPNIAPISVAGAYDKYSVSNIVNPNLSQGLIRINPSVDYMINNDFYDKHNIKTNIMDTLKGNIRPTTSIPIDVSREGFSTENVKANAAVRDDVITFGVNSASNFSNVVIYDPKLNTAVDVNATVREKNYIAVAAAAGLPIIFNTSDGKEIKLKDYTYSVANTNVNNSQFVIQINQPDVTLERNMPLFAAQTNLIMNNDGNKSTQALRDNADKINLKDLLSIPASTNIKMNGYNSDINRQQLNTANLENKAPMTSASTNLGLKGYNEGISRENQNKIQLNKLSIFGDTADRNVNNSAIGQRLTIPMGNNIKKNNDVVKLSNSFKESHYDRRPM